MLPRLATDTRISGFEAPDFAERTIARLHKSFDDGAIGVKIWKNIGMAIRAKSGACLLPDDPALLPVYEAIRKADRTPASMESSSLAAVRLEGSCRIIRAGRRTLSDEAAHCLHAWVRSARSRWPDRT
ncbi:MAG TPA: hypothetical protein VGH33_13040 [Isosphaeraceae bacterium]